MPLKHNTETLLTILLGVVILLTGFFLASVPPLPAGIGPVLLILALTIVYPLALYPLFRNNRADYAFRVLHFVPAIMTLVWLALEAIAFLQPSAAFLTTFYVWGWTILAVLIGFFLLMIFCIQVLRRWVLRIALLWLLLLPFAALAVFSVTNKHWERQVAAALWTGPLGSAGRSFVLPVDRPIALNTVPNVTTSGSFAFVVSSSNSSSSARAQGPFYIATLSGGNVTVIGSNGQVSSVSSASSSKLAVVPPKHIVKRPVRHRLPSSGPATELLAFLFIACTCAAVHAQARRRLVEVVA